MIMFTLTNLSFHALILPLRVEEIPITKCFQNVLSIKLWQLQCTYVSHDSAGELIFDNNKSTGQITAKHLLN